MNTFNKVEKVAKISFVPTIPSTMTITPNTTLLGQSSTNNYKHFKGLNTINKTNKFIERRHSLALDTKSKRKLLVSQQYKSKSP